MKTLGTLQYGYAGAAAISEQGWFAGVLRIEDVEEQIVDGYEEVHTSGALNTTAILRPGRSPEEWRRRIEHLRREVCLLTNGCETMLATADLIGGIAVATGASLPVVVWTERVGYEWRIMLYNGTDVRPVLVDRKQYRNPSAVFHHGRLYFAVEYVSGNRERVGVWDEAGKKILDIPGRSPSFASGDGLVLAVERLIDVNTVGVSVLTFEPDSDGTVTEIPIPNQLDYGFNPNISFRPDDGACFLVHESALAWGESWALGVYRQLGLWMKLPGEAEFKPAPDTDEGVLKLPATYPMTTETYNWPHDGKYKRLAAKVGGQDQFSPVRPQVFFAAGNPAVAYKVFYPEGSHVWSPVYSIHNAGGWSTPLDVGPFPHEPDAGYSICAGPSSLGIAKILTCVPVCDLPELQTRTHETERSRRSHNRLRYMEPAWNYRVVVSETEVTPGEAIRPAGESSPAILIPNPVYDICARSPELPGEARHEKLVWGDLHAHTSYSLCLAAVNGFVQDLMRFQRDVLQCEVLCVTEHTCRMSLPAQIFAYDQCELEAAGRAILLFGTEPSTVPAHNINFYCIDRGIFHALRTAIYLYGDERDIASHIKREFPPGSVFMLRHFHGNRGGEFGIDMPRTVELFDPELEPAMEAMQIRGHRMLEQDDRAVPFPNNFLDSGAKAGLVGGTDHASGGEINSFCLTGFWVKEETPQAVFDAIRNRKTFASSNGKLALYTECEGLPMGEEVSVGRSVEISCAMSCAHTIRRVGLMRDGEILEWIDVGAGSASVTLRDDEPEPGYHWYVVTAEAEAALTDRISIGQSSPHFVTVKRG